MIIVRYVGKRSHEGSRLNIEFIAPVGHNMNSTFTLSSKSITYKKIMIIEVKVKNGNRVKMELKTKIIND